MASDSKTNLKDWGSLEEGQARTRYIKAIPDEYQSQGSYGTVARVQGPRALEFSEDRTHALSWQERRDLRSQGKWGGLTAGYKIVY